LLVLSNLDNNTEKNNKNNKTNKTQNSTSINNASINYTNNFANCCFCSRVRLGSVKAFASVGLLAILAQDQQDPDPDINTSASASTNPQNDASKTDNEIYADNYGDDFGDYVEFASKCHRSCHHHVNRLERYLLYFDNYFRFQKNPLDCFQLSL
jgi:hypothetical protein